MLVEIRTEGRRGANTRGDAVRGDLVTNGVDWPMFVVTILGLGHLKRNSGVWRQQKDGKL